MSGVMNKMRRNRQTAARDPAEQWLVLEPNRIEKQYWKDLWRYRELFAILAWRDITSCGNSRATSKPSSVWPGR
jgi:hypothetical protein